MTNGIIDTHAHVYGERFEDDIDEVLGRAVEAGVEAIVVPATCPEEFDAVVAVARSHRMVHAALGVHPHHAHEVSDADLEQLEERAVEQGAIAIGEIGLDYYYEFSPRERQHEVLRSQLRIARRLELPVILHNRESDEDLLRILEDEQDGSLRLQLHCFSSSLEVLERALALGAMISFTGNITFRKSTLDEVVARVADDRLMVETDSPYMAPVPLRGSRNEPANVTLVAEKISAIRGQSLENIIQMTSSNARRFFGLIAVALVAFIASIHGAHAQATSMSVRPVDTTLPKPLDRYVGLGGLIASSTYISGSTTEANAKFGYGGWLSVLPFASMDVDWMQVDIVYTHVKVESVADSLYVATARYLGDTLSNGGVNAPPPNFHNTLDFGLRFTANPRRVVSFYGRIGVTYFSNEFGNFRYLVEHDLGTRSGVDNYVEHTWGINGAVGIEVNIETPYLTIAPTIEWSVMAIDVIGDRTIARLKGEQFLVSQPRVGVVLYPKFKKLFDL